MNYITGNFYQWTESYEMIDNTTIKYNIDFSVYGFSISNLTFEGKQIKFYLETQNYIDEYVLDKVNDVQFEDGLYESGSDKILIDNGEIYFNDIKVQYLIGSTAINFDNDKVYCVETKTGENSLIVTGVIFYNDNFIEYNQTYIK